MPRLNLRIHPEVQTALNANKPVVALESTLITHGFSYPDGLRIARAIEEAVRSGGAVPATIAILEGQVFVGLSDEQLGYLAKARHVRKCSVRDLPIVIAQKRHGATTVAATMIIAHRSGIQIIATGGIGGIHQSNGSYSAERWDVSADMTELGRTPSTVVCAGIKSFLDLPASLEYLETQAVPVLGYGVDELPAFYSRSSGLPVDVRVDTPQAVAAIIRARNALQLRSAILLTVPVPATDEWPAKRAYGVIQQALTEAHTRNVTGKSITPYVLSRIAELSGQESRHANESLLINNAQLGAKIAVAYCQYGPSSF